MARLGKRDVAGLLERLAAGEPPMPRHAANLLVGFDVLLNEWRRDLDEYVSAGGSLIRIVSGPVGSGKTHLARAFLAYAAEARDGAFDPTSRGFLIARVDAQAQHADDDLALYAAICQRLELPQAFLNEADDRAGLFAVLSDVAERMTEKEAAERLRRVDMPVPALRDAFVGILGAIRSVKAAVGSDMKRSLDDARDVAALVSGELVNGTRSVAKLKRERNGMLFRKLSRTPGKRDARLWLESLLRAVQPLGFPGVVLVLDEHDRATERVLDRHIVQLRRKLDRLAEGHLPGVFALYFVLDTFGARARQQHEAVHQRITPLLSHERVPRRVLSTLAALRDLDGAPFLEAIGERLYAMVEDDPIPPRVRTFCRTFAAECTTLGGVDTRRFVQRLATELRDK